MCFKVELQHRASSVTSWDHLEKSSRLVPAQVQFPDVRRSHVLFKEQRITTGGGAATPPVNWSEYPQNTELNAHSAPETERVLPLLQVSVYPAQKEEETLWLWNMEATPLPQTVASVLGLVSSPPTTSEGLQNITDTSEEIFIDNI